MPIKTVLLPPSEQFWTLCARQLIRAAAERGDGNDFSGLRVIVPAYVHAQWLSRAMQSELGRSFIPPRFNTLAHWLATRLPIDAFPAALTDGERLMTLYAALRENAWLKRLFSARSNADLLPLAQTLITLSDELTDAMLPRARLAPDMPAQMWQEALAQLPEPARVLLSDEAQLVWQIWQSQFDGQDRISLRCRKMMRLAELASDDLVWVSPVAPQGVDLQFLTAYAQRRPVLVVGLDWRASALDPAWVNAWQELAEPAQAADAAAYEAEPVPAAPRHRITLIRADDLENEARLGAQAIVDWLKAGKTSIALIAQDRVVARRIRALLERAEVMVADETGWKLSTTRAASALAAWFDLIASRADTVALLDLIKSPYCQPDGMPGEPDKSAWVMQIELQLLRDKVSGGWRAVIDALRGHPACALLCQQLQRNAGQYSQRRSLGQWLDLTLQHLGQLGITTAWQADPAGQQMLQLTEQMQVACAALPQTFSFAEWRAFVSMQLESTSFEPAQPDRRVVMLPLNGARLRPFEAVLMVGCDARHLPSQPQELLFFTNAVRRECGLVTREQRQLQQLRDFAELLSMNPEVALSYQAKQDDEDNPVSPWIERLDLSLQLAGLAPLPDHPVQLQTDVLRAVAQQQPRPAAPALTPATLSASGYNQLLACPYQYFASQMLKLSELEAVKEVPDKRDLGAWLHDILQQYHTALHERADLTSEAQQIALLRQISDAGFDKIVVAYPAALGMSRDWDRIIPEYVKWHRTFAEKGWRFDQAELALERPLQLAGGAIVLRGRLDRVDRNEDGEIIVLDYKTGSAASLKKKIKNHQDQQLPFYGLLLGGEVSGACYVVLNASESVQTLNADQFATWCTELEHAIVDNFNAIADGANLPAQGVSAVCTYCKVRGLCRKGAW